MNAKSLALPFAVVLATAGCASMYGKDADALAGDAPRALPESGPVSVAWADPSGFSELRYSRNRWEAMRGNWLADLASYLRQRAETRLPAGERLEFTIVDIDRAGDYEPWHGIAYQDTRIIRDIYPPRMTVRFRRIDANGQLLAEGERKLGDPAFLLGGSPINDSDPLRYEKRMIDSWLRREFGAAMASR